MSQNDFMKALQEPLPDDFAQELRQKLRDIEAEEMPETQHRNKQSWWVMSVASIVTIFMVSIIISMMSTSDNLLTVTEESLFDWQNLETITTENIADVENLATFGNGHANEIELSPDGSQLAIMTDNHILLHNTNDLTAEPVSYELPPYAKYIQYIADGTLYVVSYSGADALSVYRLIDDEFDLLYHQVIQYETVTNGDSIAISPNGEQLLITFCRVAQEGQMIFQEDCAATSYTHITMIDLINDEDIFTINVQDISVGIFAINPQWTQIAYIESSSIYRYDITTQTSDELVRLITSDVYDDEQSLTLHFNIDGSILGLSGEMSTAHVNWDFAELLESDDREVYILERTSDDFYRFDKQIRYHPITNDVIVSQQSDLAVLDEGTNALLEEFSAGHDLVDIEISMDGQQLYTLNYTGLIRVWDWQTQQSNQTLFNYALSGYTQFSFSQDGQVFVNYHTMGVDSISFIWELTPDGITRTPLSADSRLGIPINHVAVSPDGQYIAYQQNSYLYVYDRHQDTHQQLQPLNELIQLEFNADGALVFVQLDNFSSSTAKIRVIPPEMLATGDMLDSLDYLEIEEVTFACCSRRFDFASPHVMVLTPDTEYLVIYHCNDPSLYRYTPCGTMRLSFFSTTTGDIITQMELEMNENQMYIGHSISDDSQVLGVAYCDIDPNTQENLFPQCQRDTNVNTFWQVDNVLMGDTNPDIVVPDLGFLRRVIDANDDAVLFSRADYYYTDEVSQWTTQFIVRTSDGVETSLTELSGNFMDTSPDNRMLIMNNQGQIDFWGIFNN